MIARSLLALLFAMAAARGQALTGAPQGVAPREKPTDYPSQGNAGNIVIAAENLGHGFITPWGSYAADDFIVVEVALFGDAKSPIAVASGQFQLRVNRKTTLYTQAPGMVAASIKYPDWEQHPNLTADVGAGGGDVVFGRRRPVERFPGDPRPRQEDPNGQPPRAPNGDPQGMQREPKPKIDEIVGRVALVEGPSKLPTAGYIFFPYRGKLVKLKNVELVYEGPAGSAAFPLQ